METSTQMNDVLVVKTRSVEFYGQDSQPRGNSRFSARTALWRTRNAWPSIRQTTVLLGGPLRHNRSELTSPLLSTDCATRLTLTQ